MTTITAASRLTDDDLYLFNEGTHVRLYDKLGADPQVVDGQAGTHFAVWAPNAEAVSVRGAFNEWDKNRHPLYPRGTSGIWEGFVPGAVAGMPYRYLLRSRDVPYQVDKSDPFARTCEVPPVARVEPRHVA